MLIKGLNIKVNISLKWFYRLNNKEKEREREKEIKHIFIYTGLTLKYYPYIFGLFQSPFTLQVLYE